MEIKTYDLGYCDESLYTRVVCVSRYKGNIFYVIILIRCFARLAFR